jgi:hypothetical protein
VTATSLIDLVQRAQAEHAKTSLLCDGRSSLAGKFWASGYLIN